MLNQDNNSDNNNNSNANNNNQNSNVRSQSHSTNIFDSSPQRILYAAKTIVSNAFQPGIGIPNYKQTNTAATDIK